LKALQVLARMLGVPQHQAEDALHSERAARAVLSRRNLLAAGAALAAGATWSFPNIDVIGPGEEIWVYYHSGLTAEEVAIVLGRASAAWADRQLGKELFDRAKAKARALALKVNAVEVARW
jgi:hypothetical protein